MSNMNRPIRKFKSDRLLFTDRDMASLTLSLDKVNQVTEVSWKFENDQLVITGLLPENQDIIIGHPRSARAFLDAYMIGYDHGFGDGREDK